MGLSHILGEIECCQSYMETTNFEGSGTVTVNNNGEITVDYLDN